MWEEQQFHFYSPTCELVTPLSQTEKRECAEPGGSVVYHFFRARKLVESRPKVGAVLWCLAVGKAPSATHRERKTRTNNPSSLEFDCSFCSFLFLSFHNDTTTTATGHWACLLLSPQGLLSFGGTAPHFQLFSW